MKRASGFTLIELIIVIVILGVVSVTAAPRFFDFSNEAHESTLRGLNGALKSATSMVYAKAVIAGVANLEDTTAEGIDIVYGYPAASADGIIAALNINEPEWDIFVSDTDSSIRISRTGLNILGFSGPQRPGRPRQGPPAYVDLQECYVQYDDVSSAGSTPNIVINTTGC